jgi:hypothetical protein
LFFKHFRSYCKKKANNLLILFDEATLNRVKKIGLVNICTSIGLEESVIICDWFFDLAYNFYPWVEYEQVDKRFSFEYSGNCEILVDGFTKKFGTTKKTMTHEHRVYSGKVNNIFINYGIGYHPIKIETREPIVKAKNTRFDLCALRESLEKDFWELKRFLNYNKTGTFLSYKYNNTFTEKDFEFYFFPSNPCIY